MKKYKIGDRIFYEYYDFTIGSAVVIDIERKSYNDDGKDVEFDNLILWRSENGNVSTAIEDYNTLPKSDPRVKAFIKEKKDEILKHLDDLYKATGAKTNEEKKFVRNTMAWMAKNDVEEVIKYSDLL